MKTPSNNADGKTALRHGDKTSWMDWLKKEGFDPEIAEVSKKEVESLQSSDRYYGQIVAGTRILLIDTIGIKDRARMTRYYEIMV